MNHEQLLAELTALSHEFGGPGYVLAGGGNTSAKTADVMWIKPSGLALQDMQPDLFVAIDRARLSGLYTYQPSPVAAERERAVQEWMAAARQPGQTGRPSVETPLHDMLEATFAVHTHAVLVNGLTCGRAGEATAARLFPDALWVPYIDPGYTLSMAVRERIAEHVQATGAQPSVILLENHGIFVAGPDGATIRRLYREVLDGLRAEYQRARVATELTYTGPVPAAVAPELAGLLQELLGADAAHVVASAPFPVVVGPLTPDHMVYAKAQAYGGALNAQALQAFRQQHGYAPRVLVTPDGVYGMGRSATAAQRALDLARDGALVAQLSAAFGGIRLMSEAARLFIETWEVESYREKQSASKGGGA